MLNRIVVDIVHMRGVIIFICDGMFPKAPLPDATFMAFDHDIGKIFGFGDGF